MNTETLYERPDDNEKGEKMSKPYGKFENTLLWKLVDEGIEELIENQDIQETTNRYYIVGYLCEKLSLFACTEIDGARIIQISLKHSFGYSIDENNKKTEITYLAICRYGGKSEVYLFACDKHLNVVGDTVHDSIEEAVNVAENYYEKQEITWRMLQI